MPKMRLALALDESSAAPDRRGMEPVSPLPTQGSVFFDPRDEGRFLRVSFHDDLQVYVLSLWRDDTCLATFRLAVEEAPRLVHALVASLIGGEAVASGDTSPQRVAGYGDRRGFSR